MELIIFETKTHCPPAIVLFYEHKCWKEKLNLLKVLQVIGFFPQQTGNETRVNKTKQKMSFHLPPPRPAPRPAPPPPKPVPVPAPVPAPLGPNPAPAPAPAPPEDGMYTPGYKH